MKFSKFSNYPNTVRRGIQAYNNQYRRAFDQVELDKVNFGIADGTARVVAVEKLDGENFKVGWKGPNREFYIGQRNSELDSIEKHPNRSKFSDHLVEQLERLSKPEMGEEMYQSLERYLKLPEITVTDITLFGELVGDSMQRRFKWDFEGLRVFYYDLHVKFTSPSKDEEREFDTHRFALGYRVFSVDYWPNSSLDMAPFMMAGTLQEVVDEYGNQPDFEPIQAVKAHNNYGVSEGYVISPVDPTTYPWYIKIKSKPFLEKSKKITPKVLAKSEHIVFVTDERMRHVMDALVQDGQTTEDELKDIQSLGKTIPMVIRGMMTDIQEEEGMEYTKSDRKALPGAIVRLFKGWVFSQQ